MPQPQAHLCLGSLGDDLQPLDKSTQDTAIYCIMYILEELSLVGIAHSLQWTVSGMRLWDLEVLGDLESFLLVGRDDSEDVGCRDCGRCNVSVGDFLRGQHERG